MDYIKNIIKALPLRFLRKIVFFISLRPKLKYFLLKVIFRNSLSQTLKIWLSDLCLDADLENEKTYKSPLVLKTLTPRAQALYNDLNETIKGQSKF
jgi:hypothetical protein